ncbi:MAG: hypothetical protein HOG19_13670 [Gammaproteobacteria bacterium]|nr:hypothetical protein [Gammaproteobacteria bacterium]
MRKLADQHLILFILLLLLLGLSLSAALANHAGEGSTDTSMSNTTSEMVAAANAILETVAAGPGGIENAVGYNRKELLHLEFTDDARTNYVYWPYLRKGLSL